MTTQQAQEIATYATSHGLLKLAPSKLSDAQIEAIKDAKRIERSRNNQRKMRERRVEMGLTVKGKPRQRPFRLDLTGWTDEQKRARQLAQQKAWNFKNRATRNLCT